MQVFASYVNITHPDRIPLAAIYEILNLVNLGLLIMSIVAGFVVLSYW